MPRRGEGSAGPPGKSSPSSPSSSRSRKNQMSHTISAPTSKTRSPIMKIHPSSVTSPQRLSPLRRRFQPSVDQPAGDRQPRRQPQRAALGDGVLDRGAGEPAHVVELLVAALRLARDP